MVDQHTKKGRTEASPVHHVPSPTKEHTAPHASHDHQHHHGPHPEHKHHEQPHLPPHKARPVHHAPIPPHSAPIHSMKPSHPAIKITKKKLPPMPKPELRNERDIAIRFASQVHKRFTSLIKATVMFGSQAKKTATPSSDIDIVVIIDDASVNWDLELIAWYREELGKLVGANRYGSDLHVNTIKLTTWWQDLIAGDPVVLNIIRYGDPLIDVAGFFKPLKALLQQGKIHSTPESVYNALQRAPLHLTRSRMAELGAIEGVYWTMVDSAQAALITAGQLPPSPEHMTSLLKEFLVDKGLMKMEFVYWYRDCFALHKSIIHGHVTDIKGADIDVWQQRAEQFMKKMTEIIDHLLSMK